MTFLLGEFIFVLILGYCYEIDLPVKRTMGEFVLYRKANWMALI